MSEAHYQTGADALAGWRDDVLTGTPPTLYPVGLGANPLPRYPQGERKGRSAPATSING